MKKILVVFGTRPEAIKLAPLIFRLKKNEHFNVKVCLTAQHRQMLDQVIDLFQIAVDYDLNIMSHNQNLSDITTKALNGLQEIYSNENPDIVIVQGDTTTAFVAALGAFYQKAKVAHVEAGLRTWNKYSPFPEEKNRHLVSVLTDFHFAPTEWAKENLIKEGNKSDCVWVTGNTVIDALTLMIGKYLTKEKQKGLQDYFERQWSLSFNDDRRIILVTGHRRENFGDKFENICTALKKIADRNPGVKIVYPVHLNPNVRKPVYDILGKNKNNVILTEPLDYEPFIYLMSKSYMVLTDSGGVQEEAPTLGKPVLVMRDTTERPEGVKAGTSKLIGTNVDDIFNNVQKMLDNHHIYEEMRHISNPYGDGKASDRIHDVLERSLC